jgi:hypothetical protein
VITAVEPVKDDDVAALAVGPLSLDELAELKALDVDTRRRLEEWLRSDIVLALDVAAAKRGDR